MGVMKNLTFTAIIISLLISFASPVFAGSSWTEAPFPASPSAAAPVTLKNLSSAAPAPDNVPGEGTLVCNCDPAGAEVYLNGISIGEAPLRKEHIKAGVYTLTFKSPGYEDAAEKITIKKGVTLTMEEQMAPARGSIKLYSDPEGAAVLLDGKAAGVTPVTLTRVSGGKHEISFEKDYFEPSEQPVAISPGASAEIHAQLKRRLLFINIDGGAGGPALKALGRLKGLDIIPTPLDKLKEILCARELDPASLEFLSCLKMKLDLEDSAVLASLLEQERAELALAISEKQDGDKKTVSLSLYCSHSTFPDIVNIPTKDESQLEEGLGRFISQWKSQGGVGTGGIGGSSGAQAGAAPAVGEAAPDDSRYLFNLALVLVSEKPTPDTGEKITLGNAYLRAGQYGKALEAYHDVKPAATTGICRGTALYRMAQAYEKMGLWTRAASAYRELLILYPDATLISSAGPKAAPLAKERLKALYDLGLVKERWWL
jgi:tetratricopeptide (TPR) repeat protein